MGRMYPILEKRGLDRRGPTSHRIVVDDNGATLGPDCVLVRRVADKYRCLHPKEAAAIQQALFGPGDDPDRLFILSRGIARSLNAGNLALAQIYGLRIPLPDLDAARLRRLATAAPFIKANFNPDEPRIPAGEPGGGEWTDGGTGASGDDASPDSPLLQPQSTGSSIAIAGTATSVGVEAAASIFGSLGRTALAGLGELAAGMSGPTAFLGTLFLPTNSSLVSAAEVPGRPDLDYVYDADTGVLEIYRRDASGDQLAITGRVSPDGLFRDADGLIIGRALGSTAVVDPDALPPPNAQTGVGSQSAAETAEQQPNLCPDPSAEITAGRSERSLAYQEQITGLPRGLEVMLNDVRFDGCREQDGTMLEAKGPGYANMMDGSGQWQTWFTSYRAIENQMENQSRAAGDRMVEWHFAEPEVAIYFSKYAEHLENVIVIYTPPN
jgi:hypothetical protein